MKTLKTILCILFILVSNLLGEVEFFKNSEGKSLRFKTTVLKKKTNTLEKIDNSAKKFRYTQPIPFTLEVIFSGVKEYEGNICYVLNQKAILENPMFGKFPGQPKTAEEYVKSYVSEEGQIMYVKKITKAGGNINTNKEWNLPFYATMNYFYGQWMLKLNKNYLYKAKTNKGTITIKVTDVIEKNKKKYFIVHYLSKNENKVISDLIYWIDVSKRVAVSVKSNYKKMDLVISEG